MRVLAVCDAFTQTSKSGFGGDPPECADGGFDRVVRDLGSDGIGSAPCLLAVVPGVCDQCA